MGADVELVLGHVEVKIPRFLDAAHVVSSEQMYQEVINKVSKKSYDAVILAAAMSDFTPERKIDGKIKSGKQLTVNLQPTKKLSDDVLKRSVNSNLKLVTFKAEHDVTDEVLITRAREKLIATDSWLTVANDVGRKHVGFGVDTNEVFLIKKNEKEVQRIFATKKEIALKILDELFDLNLEMEMLR